MIDTAATGDLGVHVLGRLDCRGQRPRQWYRHGGWRPISASSSMPRSRTRSPRRLSSTFVRVSPGQLRQRVISSNVCRLFCRGWTARTWIEVVGSHGQHGRSHRFLQTTCARSNSICCRCSGGRHSIDCPVPTAPFLVPSRWMSSDNLTGPVADSSRRMHRCPDGGGQSAPTAGGWGMVDRSAVSPYQCVGDVGGVAGPPAFPASGFRQGGPHTVRRLYQPPGGNTLGATVRLDV